MRHRRIRSPRLLTAIGALLAGLLGLVGPTVHADETSGELARFEFTFDGRILVPVTINDSKPAHMILDTGFGNTVLMLMHRETGEELGLQYVKTVKGARGAGSGENRTVHLTAGEHLALPGLPLGERKVAVLDESRDSSKHHNVGVIGGAVFIPYVVEIDFDHSQTVIHDPETFAPPRGWEELPLDFGHNLPILETTVSIAGRDSVPVRLIVDTGGRGASVLVINENKGIVTPEGAIYLLAGTGLRGDVFADHGRVSALRLGGQTLEDVIVSFWTGDEAPILDQVEADGVISIGVLYHYNLIFDYAHRRMFMRTNSHSHDPFELNMAGLVLDESTSGERLISFVIDGSSAAAHGLRKGDVISEVNGRDARDIGFLELRSLFEQDGKTIRIKIRRGEAFETLELKLRRII